MKKADWFDPEINPKVRWFGEHYGTVFLPTRPYTPRHKGKVERGVDYVQENALRGRSFASLEEQNRFLIDWERTVADTRVHGTTRRHVGNHFNEVERAALLPLPADPFPSFREARRTVHRDGHVEVERAYYSVPPEYLARQVWVRWDAPDGADLQRPDGVDRGSCQTRTWAVQHEIVAHRRGEDQRGRAGRGLAPGPGAPPRPQQRPLGRVGGPGAGRRGASGS